MSLSERDDLRSFIFARPKPRRRATVAELASAPETDRWKWSHRARRKRCARWQRPSEL